MERVWVRNKVPDATTRRDLELLTGGKYWSGCVSRRNLAMSGVWVSWTRLWGKMEKQKQLIQE